MSKYMQLTVTVQPHYPGDLRGAYPKLARHLGYLDPELAGRNPSVHELTTQLDRLLYRHEGTSLRKVLLRHRDKLRQLQEEIGRHIADWKLSAADQLLYKMEDVFEEIEWELD